MDWWVTRSLALGWRLDGLSAPAPNPTGDPSRATGVTGGLTATARYRLFTDEADRNAWDVTLGAGYLWGTTTSRATAEPIARVAFGREIGMFITPRSALTAALELAYIHGMGDNRLRGVLGAARFGFEVGVRDPYNTGSPQAPPSGRYTFSPQVLAGLAGGYGFAWGLGLTRSLTVRARADASLLIGGGAMYGGLVGLHKRLLWPAPAPMYVELQGGYAHFAGDPPRHPDSPIADLEVGFNLHAGCGLAIDAGFRLRSAVLDTRDGTRVEARAGFVNLSAQLGSAGRVPRPDRGPRVCPRGRRPSATPWWCRRQSPTAPTTTSRLARAVRPRRVARRASGPGSGPAPRSARPGSRRPRSR